MITLREGRVLAVHEGWDGVVDCEVRVTGGGSCRALAYSALVGTPVPGTLVVLNTTALERGLGTGGYALVVDRLSARPTDPPAALPPGPGHLVKARYTPHQTMVLGVEEQESPHHEILREADDLLGLPVVVADLHSALPAVLAGARATRADLTCVYVMTDGGALPAWFSRTVAGLRRAGWLTATIAAGQAFGGDLEAVTVHTALLAARHVCQADLVVLTQGPGNLGTGTRWGFSGVAAGDAVNAVGVLHGRPVAALRISGADPRPRHQGVSHHALTAFGRVALLPADVVLPLLEGDLGTRVRAQAATLTEPAGRHRLVEVALDGLGDALSACPVPLSTMGRSLSRDPAAFLSAAAAGRHAATLVPPRS